MKLSTASCTAPPPFPPTEQHSQISPPPPLQSSRSHCRLLAGPPFPSDSEKTRTPSVQTSERKRDVCAGRRLNAAAEAEGEGDPTEERVVGGGPPRAAMETGALRRESREGESYRTGKSPPRRTTPRGGSQMKTRRDNFSSTFKATTTILDDAGESPFCRKIPPSSSRPCCARARSPKRIPPIIKVTACLTRKNLGNPTPSSPLSAFLAFFLHSQVLLLFRAFCSFEPVAAVWLWRRSLARGGERRHEKCPLLEPEEEDGREGERVSEPARSRLVRRTNSTSLIIVRREGKEEG